MQTSVPAQTFRFVLSPAPRPFFNAHTLQTGSDSVEPNVGFLRESALRVRRSDFVYFYTHLRVVRTFLAQPHFCSVLNAAEARVTFRFRSVGPVWIIHSGYLLDTGVTIQIFIYLVTVTVCVWSPFSLRLPHLCLAWAHRRDGHDPPLGFCPRGRVKIRDDTGLEA